MKKIIPLLYEDGECAAFDKPAGLLTIPTEKGECSTLVHAVNEQRGRQDAQDPLHPAHRLDRDTSGVILFAKGKANQQALMQAFKDKRVRKHYIAFAHGHVKPAEGKIRIPVKDYYQRKFQKQIPAQSALTQYRVRDYYKDFTVLDVMPLTGRTNQIRIHFAKIGHPLVGEDKYAFRKDFALRFRRTALHAAALEWPNPLTGRRILVEAPLAQDMQEFLQKHKE